MIQSRLFWCAIGLAIGWAFGLIIMESGMRNGAIEAGAAEYIVNKTTGEVTFQYIRPQ